MKLFLLKTVILWAVLTSYGQEVKERALTYHTGDDRYASYSPDGKRIIFESNRTGNWDIYVMQADGQDQICLTKHNADDRRPTWHPGGDKILFESDRSGKYELYELVIENTEIRKIEIDHLEGEPVFARYSPDGRIIAVSDKKSDQGSAIKLFDAEGNLLKELMDDGFRSFYPQWSPDGGQLLFFSRHDTDNKDDEIYLISIDGSDIVRLTHWPKHNFCPAWSPKGDKIAYVVSMEQIRPEIYVMNADGSGEIRITDNEDGDTLPSWSPDGKKLLITGYRNGNFEIIELIIPKH